MTDTSASDGEPFKLIQGGAGADPGLDAQTIRETDPEAERVLDLHAAARGRLETEIRRLKASNEALIALAKANLAAQGRTHAAVIALMEAETLPALDRKLAGRAATMLGVEALRVFIEGHAPLKSARAIHGAAPDLVHALFGPDAERLGPVDRRFCDALYGAQAGCVESEALARLNFAGREGVLCLGAREAEAFAPEQSADLVHFLARVLERRIAPWLKG